MIFDTHAHYDDDAFDEDRETLLAQLKAARIERVVNVGASIHSSHTTLELIEKHDFLYGAIGVHPSETEELNEEWMNWLEEKSHEKKVVAIGEIGLDYHWEEPARDVQKYWFVRQLDLARKVKLPVIIHSRDAAADTLEIMKEHGRDLGGVIHCFSYGPEMAREYLKMGYYLGIGGVVTFTNAKKLKEVVNRLPIFIPGSQPRKTQFFPESALCGGHDRGTERHYCQRGYGKNLGKRKGALPDDRIKR